MLKRWGFLLFGLTLCLGISEIWAQGKRYVEPESFQRLNHPGMRPDRGWTDFGHEWMERLKDTSSDDSLNVCCVGRWPFGPALAVAVQSNYAYLGSGGSIYVLGISTPASPSKISEIQTREVVWGLFVTGSYLYVANGPSGQRHLLLSTSSWRVYPD